MDKMLPEDGYAADINSKFLGISTSKLMENAGKAVAEVIKKESKRGGTVTIVAGKGNNGGDAFVTARHLWSMGYNVTVFFLGRKELIKSDEAKNNFQILKELKGIELKEIRDSTEIDVLEQDLKSADIIVDGILGIGITGSARGLPAEAIKTINNVGSGRVFSIDVPSGFDVSAGEPKGVWVKADIIVTFSDVKNGLNEKIGGKIIVKNIGVPPEARTYTGPGDLLVSLGERNPWAHKGQFGHVLIIGGSKKFSGAPTLSALSCLKTGADLVTVAAPTAVSPIIRGFSPDIILEPLHGEYFKKSSAKNITNDLQKFDVVILGPGLGTKREVFEATKWVTEKIVEHDIPLVVDADGLKALGELGIPQGKIIFTPHAGEFNLMFGEKPPRELEKRSKIVREYANQHNVIILLKGHIDIISNGEKTKLNDTGNPGMTVGGTGDVLSGIIGGLLAQDLVLFKAATCGAFISGLAGDKAFENLGNSLTASDVIDHIPITLEWIKNFA